MSPQSRSPATLLTTADVAAILLVHPKTVVRWATSGKLSSIRTPGGDRRYLKAEVTALMTAQTPANNRASTSGPGGAAAPGGGTWTSRWEKGRVERIPLDDGHAAADAALTVALHASKQAAEVEPQADASALQVTFAAAQAAAVVAAATPRGTDGEAAITASRIAATVTSTAAVTAQEAAASAARVAHDVATAATELALAVTALDMAIGSEVARAAAAVQTRATAAAAARQVASDAALLASGVALAVRSAVDAAAGSGRGLSQDPQS